MLMRYFLKSIDTSLVWATLGNNRCSSDRMIDRMGNDIYKGKYIISYTRLV